MVGGVSNVVCNMSLLRNILAKLPLHFSKSNVFATLASAAAFNSLYMSVNGVKRTCDVSMLQSDSSEFCWDKALHECQWM